MKRKPIKVAVSTAPEYTFTDSDFNALDSFVEAVRKKDREPVFVTHPFAENLDAVRRFTDRAELKFQVLDVDPEPMSSLENYRRAVDETNARLVVLCVQGALKLGEGGRIAREAAAAGLPVWKFTPKPVK